MQAKYDPEADEHFSEKKTVRMKQNCSPCTSKGRKAGRVSIWLVYLGRLL